MKKLVLALAVVTAALCACTKAENLTSVSDEARVVKFSMGNFYSFNTRAAIAQNAHVAVYASAPINMSNQDYTVSAMPTAEPAAAGTLAGSSIMWGVEQIGTNTASKFFAMYPRENIADRNNFSTSNDLAYDIANASDEAYAKDFLVDVVEQAPGADVEHPNPVSFALEHPFAMLKYVITNTSDDAIMKVEIYGVHKTGDLAYNTAAITPTGDALTDATLREMPLESAENNVYTYYSVIIPENSINPTIKITTYGGCTSTYSLTAAQNFVAGKIYSAVIAYSNTHSATTSNRTMTASFTVADWENENVTAGAQTNYNGNEEYWPILRGEGFEGASWDTGTPMTCVGENSFRAVITLTEDAEIKVFIPHNNNWCGGSATETVDTWTKVTTGGSNVAITGNNGDICTIYFYSDNSEIWYKVGNEAYNR